MTSDMIPYLTQIMKDEIRRLGDERRRLAAENEVLKANTPAAPVVAEGLTDEQIHDIMSKHVDCDYQQGLAFARAILAAHGRT